MKSKPINKMSKRRLRVELINALSTAVLLEEDRAYRKLKLELAESNVKGITEDRDELQVEHEALMEACDRIIADREALQDIGRAQDDMIHNLKIDLKNCNDRTEKYRLRSISYESKANDLVKLMRLFNEKD